MGSAKVPSAKPHVLPMAESDKKSIKNILKKLFQKDKKKDKNVKTETKAKECSLTVLTENLHKLTIEKAEKFNNESIQEHINSKSKIEKPFTPVNENTEKVESKEKIEDSEEDESDNFSVKVIKEELNDEKRTLRNDSQSSGDSGFSEKSDLIDANDKVVDSLKNLKIEDDKAELKEVEKKKKLQTVVVSRGPIKGRIGDSPKVHPYTQVNVRTFTGGQMIVNQSLLTENVLDEINEAIHKNDQNLDLFTDQEKNEYLDIVNEYITQESIPVTNEIPDVLSGFDQIEYMPENYETFIPIIKEPNPIQEFTNINVLNNFENEHYEEELHDAYIFPTPPRSETMQSPNSTLDSPESFYPTNSDYTLSPEGSSPFYNSDHEVYQEITHVEEEEDTRERAVSTSSMNMKQFKDMQKELSNGFSKKECCHINRKTCKQMFLEHAQKLSIEERKNLCLNVASFDMNKAYGVLHHILLSLSKSSEQEDLQHALFSLICERSLVVQPSIFLGDSGLSLIKAAVLRCHDRPLFTRYLVQCMRLASRHSTSTKEYVFNEVDALGDNLLIACVRAGDAYAPVLNELVRDQPPLFNVNHANTDGYTALHVACKEHSESSPRLHTLHVLLEHAHADIWKGDIKGGDTALHLAINSPTCDLQAIMIIFKNVDRKLWKKLAHSPNRSSVTPLEYARSAKNSRQNYPQEVLNFLKKCR